MESIAWRDNQSHEGLYYDKVVEKVLHYSLIKLYESAKVFKDIAKSQETFNSDLLIILNRLKLLSENANYRTKLNLTVKVI